MKTGEYKTLHADTPEELDQKVSEAIKQGYKPYGNPYFVSWGEGKLFCQAVVSPSTSF